ncbi:MAG: cation:dicarboxylase symporter family transporter, partial [Lacrimispora sp.]
FTTTSSAVTLPVEIEDSEKKLGISKKVTGIVIPLAMTLNSNGLAMFLALSCITISQIYGVPLHTTQLVRIIVLSTLSCLGTVTVPGGGLVALATVVPALGLPLESIAFLFSIDWFSGMFRTILNVDTDVLVAMIIAKDEKELDYEILNGKQ